MPQPRKKSVGSGRAVSARCGYVDPALEAMALLATAEHAKAHRVLRQTVADGRRGMDPMPLMFIRYNSWNDPTLETPEWLKLRNALAFKAR